MEWISVKDRLPEHLDRVIICFDGGHVMMAGYHDAFRKNGEFIVYFADGRKSTERRITHWMPLPEPPKQ